MSSNSKIIIDNSLSIGSSPCKEIYVGSSSAKCIYVGSTRVYDRLLYEINVGDTTDINETGITFTPNVTYSRKTHGEGGSENVGWVIQSVNGDGASFNSTNNTITITNNKSLSSRSGTFVIKQNVSDITVQGTWSQKAGYYTYSNITGGSLSYGNFYASGSTLNPSLTPPTQTYGWNGNTNELGNAILNKGNFTITSSDGFTLNSTSTGNVSAANRSTTTGASRSATVSIVYTSAGNGATKTLSAICTQEANNRTHTANYIIPYKPDTSWIVDVTNNNWNDCPADGGYVIAKGYYTYTYTSKATLDEMITDDAELTWSSGFDDWIIKHNWGYYIYNRFTTIGNSRTSTATWTSDGLTSTGKSITQVANYVTSISPSNLSLTYGTMPASGGTVTPSSSIGTITYTFTSNQTTTTTPSSTYGTLSTSKSFSWGGSQNGFTSINSSTGAVVGSDRGSTTGTSRLSTTITMSASYTWTPTSSYPGGTKTASSTKTATCTQEANSFVGYSYDNPTITVNSVSDIPASGGTSSVPSCSYSQIRRYNYTSGNDKTRDTLTSGGTLYYGTSSNPSSTATSTCTITKTSLGTNTTNRTKVGSSYIKVVMNSLSAQNYTDVYQEANAITNYSSITGLNATAEGDIPASGGSRTINVTNGSQTITFTSNATRAGIINYTYSTNNSTWSSTKPSISASTLGTTVQSSRVAKGTIYVKANGEGNKTATKNASIYQGINVIVDNDYSGSNSTYKATCSIGSGIVASGGSATITASAYHTHSYRYLYTSNAYDSIKTRTDSDGYTLSETSDPNNRFSISGTKLNHSSMGTTATTDSVTIKCTNNSDTSATASTSTSVTNSITGYTNCSATATYHNTSELGSTDTPSISVLCKPVYTSNSTGSNVTVSSSNYSISNAAVTGTGASIVSTTGVITWTENQSLSSRTATVSGMKITLNSSYSSIYCTATISTQPTQSAGYKSYSNVTGSISYGSSNFNKAGEDRNISSSSATQTWGWNGNTTNGGNYTCELGSFKFSGSSTGWSFVSTTTGKLRADNNKSLSTKSVTVYRVITGGGGKSATVKVTVTQNAGTKNYQNPVPTNYSYSIIPASGGTVYPTTPSFSQKWGWNNSDSDGGTITTGGTYTRYVNGSTSSDGKVSAATRGTSTGSQITIASNCYVKVTSNGKTGQTSSVSVYLQANSIDSYTSMTITSSSAYQNHNASSGTVTPSISVSCAPVYTSKSTGNTIAISSSNYSITGASMTSANGASINTSNGVITWTANNTSYARTGNTPTLYVKLSSTYSSLTGSTNANKPVQNAPIVTGYSNTTLSLTYTDVPASGGTASPTLTATQVYHFDNGTSALTNVTSLMTGTLYYGVATTNVNQNTGIVTYTTSLGTSITSSRTWINGNWGVYANTTINGINASTVNTTPIYQAINKIEYYTFNNASFSYATASATGDTVSPRNLSMTVNVIYTSKSQSTSGANCSIVSASRSGGNSSATVNSSTGYVTWPANTGSTTRYCTVSANIRAHTCRDSGGVLVNGSRSANSTQDCASYGKLTIIPDSLGGNFISGTAAIFANRGGSTAYLICSSSDVTSTKISLTNAETKTLLTTVTGTSDIYVFQSGGPAGGFGYFSITSAIRSALSSGTNQEITLENSL